MATISTSLEIPKNALGRRAVSGAYGDDFKHSILCRRCVDNLGVCIGYDRACDRAAPAGDVHYHRFAHRCLLAKKLSQLFDGICDDDYQLSVLFVHCANYSLDDDATTRTTELRLHDDQIDGTACIYRTFCNGTNGCDHGKENTFFNCFWVSGSWHHKTS